MRSYLSLVPISAKVHKRQNRMTILCIVLSVFLVTSIFSMADIWGKAESAQMMKRHGKYHIMLSGISKQTAEQIAQEEDVFASSECRVLNYNVVNHDYYVGEKNVILYGTNQSYIDDIRSYASEGAYPQNEKEVMLSINAKEDAGIGIGDSAVIHTPAGSMDYTVSGFCTDDIEYNGMIDGFCVYMNAEGFDRISAAGYETAESKFYIRFAEGVNLKKAIAHVREKYGLSDENVQENTAVLGLAGASSKQSFGELYRLAGVLFVVILIAGALMISSCMNSNVAQRTKFFGMMRCIGASRKQIIHFVRLEALSWCKSAVPIGCMLGIAVTWIMCIFLKNVVGGEFAEFTFSVSILGIVCGAAVGVITVLIAAHSPAKKAAGVSPVAAVSGNAEIEKHGTHGANTHFFKVETALGIHHAVAAKKNLILMTMSFAFTVILFFSFFAFLAFAKALTPSLNSFTPDVAIAAEDTSVNSVDRNLKEEIEKLPGIEAVFGNAFALDIPAEINGTKSSIDLLSYDDYMLNWSKDSIISGDISKVTDDSDYALTIFNRDSRLNVGDQIKIGDTQVEIACVASEGIWGDARAVVVCSEGTFRRITGEKNYMLLNAKFTKDVQEETVRAIRDMAGENLFTDHREGNKTTYSSYWVFRSAAYGFLAIIVLIMVFNIMNSISMSVSARIRQYGAMRAVGMSARQLTGMIAAEAATYAVCGLAVGGAAGLFLNRLITVKLIVSHFGGHWSIPWDAAAVIVPIVVLSCILAVRTPAKRIRDMEITDTINEL